MFKKLPLVKAVAYDNPNMLDAQIIVQALYVYALFKSYTFVELVYMHNFFY